MRNNVIAQRGFTLMEVLVAGLIIFISIVTMSQIHQGALLTSTKAVRTVDIVSVMPVIKESIIADLDAQKMSSQPKGQGFVRGMEYYWQATARATTSSDISASTMPNQQIILWFVNININYDGYSKDFEFWQVTN